MRSRSLAVVYGLVLIVAACSSVTQDSGVGHDDRESLAVWTQPETLAELVKASDVIVRATVIQKLGEREARSNDQKRVPVAFTEYRLRADSAIKGMPGMDFVVVQVGRAGDSANTFPEFPLLRPGQRVLVFLRDVSGEEVHRDGTQKFSMLGPVALYEVVGNRVATSATGFALSRQLSARALTDLEAEVTALAVQR